MKLMGVIDSTRIPVVVTRLHTQERFCVGDFHIVWHRGVQRAFWISFHMEGIWWVFQKVQLNVLGASSQSFGESHLSSTRIYTVLLEGHQLTNVIK